MSVATAADRDRIATRWTDDAMAVVAFCGTWCDTCGAALLHYGVSLPQEAAVARLIDAMTGHRDALDDPAEAALELPRARR